MTHIGRRGFAVTAGIFGLAGTLFASSRARAATTPRIVRLGVVNPPSSAPGQACQAFAAAAATHQAFGNSVRVEVHSNGELGGEVEMVRACAAGIVDLVFAASNVVATLVPELGLLDAPFLFRDAPHARATLDGPFGADYIELLRKKNLHLLAWGENGVRHVTANNPVRGPQDLRGLRIRVPQSEMMIEGFRALGASPEALPFPQVYEALRTGRFEAQENPVATIAAAKFAQVQRYLSLTGHAYSAAFFLASPDLMEEMSVGQIDALAACAQVGAQASRDAASQGEQAGLDQLRADGMLIVDDVDRAALAVMSRSAIEAASVRYGAERVARIRSG